MKTLMFTSFNSEGDLLITPFEDDIDGEEDEFIYIDGEAESLASFDLPYFFSGDMAQLKRPVEKQDIIMVLPSGEYPIKAIWEPNPPFGQNPRYLLQLK